LWRHPIIISAIRVSVYTAVAISVPIAIAITITITIAIASIINIAVVSISISTSVPSAIAVMSWHYLWGVMLLGIMRVWMLVMMRHMTVVLWGWVHRWWM